MDLTHSDEIAGAIRTRHLQTPLSRALSFDEDASAAAVVAALDDASFDVAPVMCDGQICGYVRRADIVGVSDRVGDYLSTLTAQVLIAGDTPLRTLLAGLRSGEMLFVVEERSIAGIVTAADLNKQPGRAYFYLLVAALEMTFAEKVRGAYADQSEVLGLLSPARREAVRERLVLLQHADVLADVVGALDLTDLLKIVGRDVALRAPLGDYSLRQWQSSVISPVLSLRNDLMHSVRTLATDTPASLARLVALDERLRNLVSG